MSLPTVSVLHWNCNSNCPPVLPDPAPPFQCKPLYMKFLSPDSQKAHIRIQHDLIFIKRHHIIDSCYRTCMPVRKHQPVKPAGWYFSSIKLPPYIHSLTCSELSEYVSVKYMGWKYILWLLSFIRKEPALLSGFQPLFPQFLRADHLAVPTVMGTENSCPHQACFCSYMDPVWMVRIFYIPCLDAPAKIIHQII